MKKINIRKSIASRLEGDGGSTWSHEKTLKKTAWYAYFGDVYRISASAYSKEEVEQAFAANDMFVEEIQPELYQVVQTHTGVKHSDTESYRGEDSYSHESYGIILGVKNSGRQSNQFGTDIDQGSITFTIRSGAVFVDNETGERSYSVARNADNPFFLEFSMSKLQFAEMITNMNHGEGIPCTFKYRDSKRIRYQPFTDKTTIADAHSKFKEKVQTKSKMLNEDLNKAKALLNKKGTLKKAEKEEIEAALNNVKRLFNDSLPYLSQQLNDRSEEAITEVRHVVESLTYEATSKIKTEQEVLTKIADGVYDPDKGYIGGAITEVIPIIGE